MTIFIDILDIIRHYLDQHVVQNPLNKVKVQYEAVSDEVRLFTQQYPHRGNNEKHWRLKSAFKPFIFQFDTQLQAACIRREKRTVSRSVTEITQRVLLRLKSGIQSWCIFNESLQHWACSSIAFSWSQRERPHWIFLWEHNGVRLQRKKKMITLLIMNKSSRELHDIIQMKLCLLLLLKC